MDDIDFDFEDEEEPKNFDISRVKQRILEFFDKFKDIPKIIRYIFHIFSSPSNFVNFIQEMWTKSQNLPIVIFYKYLWEKKKTHLFFNIFVNYVFPIILENLPWYFSQSKLGKELRGIKNKLQHSMVRGDETSFDTAKFYILYTTIHCALITLDRHLRNRVSLLNKFDIKRLVLERLVYSEIWALDFYEQKDLERRISVDIQSTVQMFSTTVPQMFSNLYTIYSEFSDLYVRKEQIDPLAILRPMTSIVVWRVWDWCKETIMGKKIATPYIDNENVKLVFSGTIDGLIDLQLNNAQNRQLEHFDGIVKEEFDSQEDIRFFLNRYYSIFTQKSIFDFLFEILITTHVMKKRGITHEQFKKIQLDIDHAFSLVRRTGNLAQRSYRILENQGRIIHLMNLPNFQFEDLATKKLESFDKIHIKDITFSYGPNLPNALDFKDEIIFNMDKIYAIIGQNRSGKSTLVHLLCRLYTQQSGSILFDEHECKNISRNSIRNLISYVSQKPYIFSGTIKDNINLGNPDASIEELMEAAENAGVFTFELKMKKKEHKKDKHNHEKPEEKKDEIKKEVKKEEEIEKKKEISDKIVEKGVEEEVKEEEQKEELTKEKKMEILNFKTVPRGSNLSGGFQQSVALARIFLKKDTRLIILDESTCAMDPIKKKSVIMPKLIEFVKKKKIGLILVTHDMSDLKFAEHIIMMSGGKIEGQGTYEDLQSNEKFMKMTEK